MTSTPATLATNGGYGPDDIIRVGFLAAYSQPTRGHYQMVLDQWFAWCHHHGIRPVEAKRAHIELWARELDEVKGLMASTIAGKLTAVCGMYRYAQMDGYLATNEGQWVKRPYVSPVSRTQPLTVSELHVVLDAAERTHLQDHALLCVLAYTGVRVGELCRMQIEHFGMRRGQPFVWVDREKNEDPDDLPLVPRAAHAAQLWRAGRSTGPMWLQRDEVPMDRRGVDRIVKRIGKKAGITKPMHPHVFRHSFATIGLDSGADMRNMQHSLGHKSIRSLATYDHFRNSLENNASHWVARAVESQHRPPAA